MSKYIYVEVRDEHCWNCSNNACSNLVNTIVLNAVLVVRHIPTESCICFNLLQANVNGNDNIDTSMHWCQLNSIKYDNQNTTSTINRYILD